MFLCLPVINPAERLRNIGFIILLLLVHGSLGKLSVPSGQAAEILPLLLAFAANAGDVLHIPRLDQVLDDVGIVDGGVNAESLGHSRKVIVQLCVLAIRHQLRGHDDLPAHHISEDLDEAVGVALQDLRHKGLVGLLVTALVAGNDGTDSGQVLVALLAGQLTNVAVADLGGALLEGGVDEATVGVLLCSWVEAGSDEMLNGNLDGAHVAAAAKVQVLIEEITVAVLLGGPAAAPTGPGRVARAGRIIASLEGVQEGLIGGEGLLCYHIANQHNEDIVRHARGLSTEITNLLLKVILSQVGEVVLRLPSLITSLEKHIVHHGPSNGGKIFDNFNVLGIQELGPRQALLEALIVEVNAANVLVFLLGDHGRVDRGAEGGARATD
mmetsp:Transcript_16540/g.47483  ORF Transcript_16540/g.47483 Transcript_16540/m.47483 type:complete len:383 (+) Transcript_16540:161-1309(+)